MKNQNSEKTFSYYLNELENSAESLKSFPDSSVSNIAYQISANTLELRKALSGIRLILLFLSSIVLLSIIITITALSSNKFRSYFVEDNLALKDSLLNINDENVLLEYRTQKGKIVTYSDLVKENDTLIKKYHQFKSDIDVIKSELDLCNLQLRSSEKDLNSYRMKVMDSHIDKIKNSVREMEKVDSGKILLDAFRNKMIYDPSNKTWKIDMSKK